MARKTKGAKMLTETAEATKIKPVRLDLTAEVHTLLRRVSAFEGVSMACYARDAIEQLLRDEAKRLGIKT